MDKLKRLYNYIKKDKKKKILFLTTSNRWEGEKELPKSSMIAAELKKKLKNAEIIDVSKLKIFPCEGNVSAREGNNCGVKEAMLKSNNPEKFIRCWASINNKTDEMHKVANAIYDADIIVFFGSIRWGKMNAIYSQIIERLTWLENRHTTLGESNIIKDKECGVVAIGHNWNGDVAIKTEKEVTKTLGGIILPETAEGRDTKIGTVVSVGEGIYTNDGVKIPMTVGVGDKVMMPFAGSAQKVKLGDEDYLLFREQELLMVMR